jgi:biofilm PGA synthesis N-glycosyltransferase PgaC
LFGGLFWVCVIFIIYTYFLFPALLALFAALKPRKDHTADQNIPDDQLPTVTLLIAAYNEQDAIARKLENSLALDYPKEKLQILVADDCSDDNTAALVNSFSKDNVRLCKLPQRRGKMSAINHAMSYATGDIVVISDANNLYQKDAFHFIAEPFADPKVGGVTGSRHILTDDGLLSKSESIYWRYESFIKTQETRLSSCTCANGEALAIRRNLFEAPPASIINDDFYIAMQLVRKGYRLVYSPQVVSSEPVSISASGEIERRARIIAGRYQAILRMFQWLPYRQPVLVWQVISHKVFRPLVPLAMIGALVGNVLAVMLTPPAAKHPLLSLAPPYGAIALSSQVLFYASAALGAILEKKGRRIKIFYLTTFLVNSNWAALIGLFRFLFNRQPTTWKRVARGVVTQGSMEK